MGSAEEIIITQQGDSMYMIKHASAVLLKPHTVVAIAFLILCLIPVGCSTDKGDKGTKNSAPEAGTSKAATEPNKAAAGKGVFKPYYEPVKNPDYAKLQE